MSGDRDPAIELAGTRILVIEDEAFSRQVVQRTLHQLGIDAVEFAENGRQALDLLGALETDQDTKFDLIICDIEMPEMDGYEFVRHIRTGDVPAYKTIPIIMLTGKDTDKNVRRAKIYKIDGFIVKPAEAKILNQRISQALGLTDGE